MSDKLKNIATLVVSVTVFYIVLETFVWRPQLPQLPLTMHASLGRLKPLAQISKDGLVPKDYVLIIGDSYAEGLGDWLMREVGNGNPPHNAAHVLHDATGRDVMYFGKHGGHPSMTYTFSTTSAYAGMQLYWGLGLEPPRDVVAYFFEGNDINDTLASIKFYLGPDFDQSRKHDRAYVAAKLRATGADGRIRAQRRWHGLRNAHLFDTSIKLVKLAGKNVSRGVGHMFDPTDPVYKAGAAYKENWSRYTDSPVRFAMDDGSELHYPRDTVEPFAFYDDAALDLGALWYGESLKYLRRLFPTSKIWAIYIPTPVMSYRLTVDAVTLSDRIRGATSEKAGPPTKFTVGELFQRSNASCTRMFAAARDAGVEFIDARPAIRAASGGVGHLHGPNDPGHFNKAGYTALAGVIEAGMKAPDTARGCAELQ